MSNENVQIEKKFNAVTLGLFAIVIPNVWAFAATGLVIGIFAGGLPVLVWSSLLVGILLSLQVTSFAEFGSAYPSEAGCVLLAQKLGGPKYGNICGYITGSLQVLASFILPSCLISSNAPFVISASLVMHPEWEVKKWQSFLVYQALNIIVTFLCFRQSKYLETMGLGGAFILFCIFFASIGLIVGRADPLAPAELVWSQIQNVTGWPTGLAMLIGASAPLAGYGPTHWVLNMAEEVKNPRRSIPIAFLIQQVGSIVTLFAFFIAIGYGVGDKWEEIISSTYPAPIAAVYEVATRSKPITVALLSLLLTLNVISAGAYINAAIRLVHGFLQTKASPFHEWLGKYDAKAQLPKNVLFVMFIINVILGFLELGTSSALVTLVGAATIMYTLGYFPVFLGYLLTGGGYLGTQGWFKLPRPISLGLAFFNACSVILQAILLSLPPTNPITTSNMNWASAVAGSLLVFLFGSFWFYGKQRYQPADNVVIEGEEDVASGESTAGGAIDGPKTD
ncbi:hypothetical protein FOBRF1_013131 [Fusarium oxysporum]